MKKIKKSKIHKKDKRPVNGALIFSGIVFLLAATVSVAILFIWQVTKQYEGTFLPGLYLEEYKLDGLTPEQATSLLYDKTESKRSEWSAVLRWKGKEYRLTSQEIGLSVDREATLGPLWQIGREGSLMSRFLSIVRAKATETHVEPIILYEETPIHELLSQIKADVDRPAISATAVFDPKQDNPFSFTDEQTGFLLEIESLVESISEAAKNLKSFEINVTPQILEPEIYRAELENAICMRARVRITLDTDDSLINERMAISGLNGRTINPGDVLSFNQVVGNRSEEAGFVTADEPAFGPNVEGIGGGVCRIATMLYQASLLAALPVSERHAAVYPVPYAEAGTEAAVSDRGLDLVIQNDTGYPLWIIARDWQEQEQVYAEIQIIGQPLTIRYRLETVIETGKSPSEPVYVRDREGRYATYSDERVPNGHALPEITAYTRVIACNLDGETLSEKVITEDHYEAIAARIYVGSKNR